MLGNGTSETAARVDIKRAKDAVLLDNSFMTVDEQMTWFFKTFKQILKHGADS